MNRLRFSCTLTAALLTGAAAAAAAPIVTHQAGGELGDALVRGDVAYLGQGPAISVWSLAADGATAPQRLFTTGPLPGIVKGLAVRGDYLFASWRTTWPDGRLAVYSLADPQQPVHLLDFQYSAGSMNSPGGIAVVGDHLLLADAETGLHAIDVSNPLAPAVSSVLPGSFGLQRVAVTGSHLVAWGRTFIGGVIVEVFDVAAPGAPASVGFYSTFGNFVDGAVEGNLLVLVGDGFETVSLADPQNPAWLATVPGSGTFVRSLLLRGGLGYFGDENGIRVWDFADPANPASGSLLAAPAERTVRAAVHPLAAGAEALLFTENGYGLAVGLTAPASPTLSHAFDLPGGADPSAVAALGPGLAVADFYSGLRVLDGELDGVGRVDPAIFQGAYEDLTVEGSTGFLAAWGYGLLTFDLSSPAAPVALGDLQLDFATAVDVAGSTAHVVTSTGGGVYWTVDVSDPAQPAPLGSLPVTKGLDVVYPAGLVLVADETLFDAGGMRIIDPTDPALPVQVGRYTVCDSAGGVAASGDLAALACHDGSLHLVSLADPANPVQVGVYVDPSQIGAGRRVAIAGNVAWFGTDAGVDLVDVSDPAQPRRITRAPLAFPVRGLELDADGGAWVATGLGGIFHLQPRVFGDGFETGGTGAWSNAVP